jgi:cell division transport system permease protein
LAAKENFSKLAEIKSIDYISREKALEDFKAKNANEPVILKSLEEIGENPLLSSLIIRANQADQYQKIAEYITSRAEFKNDISRINYNKNRDRINSLNDGFKRIKKVGFALATIFAIISILIIFNTIRITIYTYKQEIEVERLVGSSNMFIRLPFIFEGITYGIIAAFFASAFLLVTVKLFNPHTSSIIIFGNSSVIAFGDLLRFYKSEIFMIFGIQVAVGTLLGILSSWIAIRKYLKI